MPWTPGYRRRPDGLSRISETMRIHASVGHIAISLYANDNSDVESDIEDDTPKVEGEDFVLYFQKGSAKFAINLSELTTEELSVAQEMIVASIAEARAVTEKRDAVAREAEANGNPILFRSLRGSPRITYFKRRKP